MLSHIANHIPEYRRVMQSYTVSGGWEQPWLASMELCCRRLGLNTVDYQ